MKKLIIILFLLPVLAFSQESKLNIPKDKILHTSVSGVLAEACYVPYYCNKWDFGTSTRMSFAVFTTSSMTKEMIDAYSGGRFSFEDIGFNAIGWLFTVSVNYGIHKIRMKKYNKKHKNK
jgi:hypothetical protein